MTYIGTFDINISESKYKNYTPNDWALKFIFSYGHIDGAHHKQWVLDQVARILHGAPISIKERRFDGRDSHFIFEVGTSDEYENWVREFCGEEDEDGDFEYQYDEGIAP